MKDITKKILIGVIILEIIIITISAVIIISKKFFKTKESNLDIAYELEKQESIKKDENVIIVELKEQQEDTQNSETLENNTKLENSNNPKEIKQEDVKTEKNSTKSEKVNQQENKKANEITQSTSSNNNKEIPSSNPVVENKKETTTTNTPSNNANNNNNNSNDNSTQTKEETTPESKVESFKYNSEMTQKLLETIKANESDYMKQYGYEVVIDSSIVNSTNQFTFTEARVKNKVIYKFGTIKVYARDYYVGNEYKWTECFII